MKKLLFIFGAMMGVIACSNGNVSTVADDTDSVVVDTVIVDSIDTVAVDTLVIA